MPSIQQLQISAFRNISAASLDFASGLNLIAGENGSGKSSILEAIHYSGLGRSFRNTRNTPVIQHNQAQCAVHCRLDCGITLGIGRSQGGPPQFRIQGEKAASPAELAHHLPLQLLNAEAFQLLEGGPKTRRQFIDWGVFHVEHRFHQDWREFKRCLTNRNALLKKNAPAEEILPWSLEFSRLASEIDLHRKDYLENFLPFLETILEKLLLIEGLTFRYYPGWNDDEPIADILQSKLGRDLALGYTTAGPQRADLKIKIGSQYANTILSRGQQKLLVSAMKLAQGAFLAAESGRQCIYLIDDLPAELDKVNRQKVCAILFSLGAQVFITGTEESELLETLSNSGFEPRQCKLFHVKHGRISDAGLEPELGPQGNNKAL